ncbi:MAG TPA: ABC transporter permease [Kofleriaceae bacterium]|nr:ABC transporter permease [Kofleriaceae bacterium]
MEILASLLSFAFFAQVVRITVPYALAATGGAVCERSGVINIALEGKLLFGAFAAAVIAHATGSATAGMIAGVAGGMVVAAIYGLAVIVWRADQIVAGVAINLLALGLTRYLLAVLYGQSANSPRIPGFAFGGGTVWANPILWLTVVAVIAVTVTVGRTRFGLRLRAVGESPEAAATLGVRVAATRWATVTLAGALAGLGGAYLAIDIRGFVAGMSGGRGYIALAAVIMGKWRPAWAACACVVFGTAEALQIVLQAELGGELIPRELLQTLPYILTMLALAGFIGRSRPPKSLGKPYP